MSENVKLSRKELKKFRGGWYELKGIQSENTHSRGLLRQVWLGRLHLPKLESLKLSFWTNFREETFGKWEEVMPPYPKMSLLLILFAPATQIEGGIELEIKRKIKENLWLRLYLPSDRPPWVTKQTS